MGMVLYRSLVLAMLLLFDCAAMGAARMSPLVFGGALPSNVSSVFVRFPQSNPSASQPLRVLVALHGIGGDGAAFAGDLTTAADQNGWILVAPTIAYGDWMDPTQVAREV
jgi:poly(3-hydroxybutyrate) depolymerase